MNFRYNDGTTLSTEQVAGLVAPYALKYKWFIESGYLPHYWQTLFHTMSNPEKDGKLCRFRHLVAGRRGGKTLSAAWEVLYYALHPEDYHWDAHREEKQRPLHIWVLAKDHVMGRAAWLTFQEALVSAGLHHGREYRENRGHKRFEFDNGTLIEYKTADDPQSLRGAGLDILWIDEAAFLTSREAWDVVRPALSDKQGLVITTTTPSGKNWFYDEFWNPTSLQDPDSARVEYTSINNPYFAKEEWLKTKVTYHPLLFKQEYMASFDSMAGKELSGDWLKYYSSKELPLNPDKPEAEGYQKYELDFYLGVDPAASLSDDADHFAMALIGLTPDRSRCYLLEIFKDRLPFPEQVDKIREWYITYKPQIIGVEANAFQTTLAEQLNRIPEFPPIYPIQSKGKKFERILSMAPLFKVGKVKIRKDHVFFIEQWVDYDSTLKNPKDDVLDAVELALRSAGAILPSVISADEDYSDYPATDITELARRQVPSSWEKSSGMDEHLGTDW
jgi:phage terminase large subunit-like protein